MALLWMDSFDHYATADLAEKYTAAFSTTIVAGAGRRAGACLRIPSSPAGADVVTPTFAGVTSTVVVGAAVKVTPSAAPMLVLVRSGATVQLTMAVSASGFLQAYRGTSVGTLLGTAVVGALTGAAFFYLELKAVIHPSAGSVVLRVNELEVLNLSGVNTAASGTGAWDNVRLNTGGTVADYDDLYILDGSGAAPLNTFLGDCRVDARYPTAEGASSAWTPSTGTDNALNVDDPGPPYTPGGGPDDDTTYNSTPTVGATDTHVVQDAPVPGAVLFGVQLAIAQKKTDAGTCTIAPVVRHAGADVVGPAVNPGTTYAYAVTPYGLNPATGLAWTEAEFNAAEFGYKRTA